MPTRHFYNTLPSVDGFINVSDAANYHLLPDDWHIVITDVRGSTKAIEAGKYKEVNMVGASAIAALLHVAEDVEVPFVFGGDGATFVIPPVLLARTQATLADARARALSAFGMDLRVGVVPVSEVRKAGHEVSISKFNISKHYQQAMFMGGGLAHAEKLIKDLATEEVYSLPVGGMSEDADLHGLSCRWRDVESRYGETVSIIVKALSDDSVHMNATYREVIEKVDELFGDISMHHPIAEEKLKISLAGQVLERESAIHATHRSILGKTLYRLRLRCILLGARFLDWLGIATPPLFDFPRYKHTLVRSTDYKKFDGVLRMIVSGTTENRIALEEYLENLRSSGRALYGIHVSDRAIMTCLVSENDGKQVHFVDGADGGYTLAAKQLKGQIAEKASK